MQLVLSIWTLVAGAAIAVAQTAPTVNLKGSLVLLDTTPDTTRVDALSVAIYSPATFMLYRAEPDQSGQFELKNILPGHYRLEMGVPSRLRTLTIEGEEVSPSDFQIAANTRGPLRIVLSMKVAALNVNVAGAPAKVPLTAVFAPNDEFLTLHSQVSSPVAGGAVDFRFLPPGRYLIFVVDTDLSGDVASDAKLREALREEATPVEVFADKNPSTTARYIGRQVIEDRKRQVKQAQ